ncbi:MAG: TetR/AcrR family transcriptional regulator [Ilumatobacteraceae bacterium]|jgi:AcrR family transcriptional regulator
MGTTRPTAELIVAEARAIVEERGEAALRVSEVAERCGVAVGLLYHYFSDREAIIAAVREAQFATRVESDILGLKALSVNGQNADIVDEIIDQYSDPRNEDRIQHRLQRMEVIVGARHNPELLESLRESQSRLTAEILETIRNAKENGLVAPDVDDKSLGFFLEVIPIGTALATVYGDNLPDPDKWRDFMVRVLAALMPSD